MRNLIRCLPFALTVSFLLVSVAIAAEEQKPQPLTLDRIFNSTEFDGQSAPAVQWSERRGGYFSLEPIGGDTDRSLVWHDTASDRTETVVPSHHFSLGEGSPISVESYQFSHDESKLLIFTNSKRVWRARSRGDYWVLDITTGQLKKIGGDVSPSTLMFAKFSPDGNRVAYVRENNLYVQDLADMHITALTDDGNEKRINGTFDWVYEEELFLRDGFRWSPDGQSIAYWQLDVTGVPEMHLINNIDSFYPQVQTIPYPKAGETNSAARVGVVPAAGGRTQWLAVPGDPRQHYIAQMDWSGDSSKIILQQFNRLQNTNQLMLASAASGVVSTVITERDDAWVENSNSHLRWVEKGKRLVWLSERDGWQHAYLISLPSGETTQITKGDFDVVSIEAIDSKEGWVYYIASPDNPTQRYLYRCQLDGGHNERLTPTSNAGTHTYTFSPDAKFAVHNFSTFDSPPVTDLISLPKHESVRMIAENKELQEKIGKLSQLDTEFFRVDIGSGVGLDGWFIKPLNVDPSKKYPLLVYVYGETAAQTVLDRWGGKRHLWHLMLAQQGYAVASIDNRGTPSPRGRQWRKCVYKQIGILSSADQAAAVRTMLGQRTYLDSNRVAVWGWSGGGSMTLNAIFRYPDLYQAAMSVAPVPNQRLYDTIYQERYMGLPSDNAEGYRNGSPITYASQLKGQLLLVHGTGDDNVHYQGTEKLVNDLIAYNKQFRMFAYPVRSHSISERKNTTRHLFGLLTDFLTEKIPAGGR